MKISLLFASLLIPFSSHALLHLGHNISATSDTLRKNECTIGLQLGACGLSDDFSLAFSPWMYSSYNLANIASRIRINEDSDGNKEIIQLVYFKNYKKRENNLSPENLRTFQMEAVWLAYVKTWALHPYYRLHLNLQSNYYMDEQMPFSLRRPFVNRKPTQFNISTLHETRLINGWFIFGELGLLDFAQEVVHFHTGASIGKDFENLSFHIGFTMTSTPEALFDIEERNDYQHFRRSYPQGYDGDLDAKKVKYDFSIHPEFSLQYYF